MANHSSSRKAVRQTLKKTLINKKRKSSIKTYIKNVLHEINHGTKDSARAAFIVAQSKVMQGVKKNILKLNTASRKISSLSMKMKAMSEK